MPSDPFFEEFKKIRKMFQKAISGDNITFGGTSQGISIKQIGDKTKVDIHGDISEEEVERLKRKYPGAEINVNGKAIESSGPVKVLDRDEKVEDSEEDEIPPQDLALKRFKEKKEQEKEEEQS